MKYTWLCISCVFSIVAWGQSADTTAPLASLTKLDLGFQGIGITREKTISPKMTIDFSAGFGGGYNISKGSIGYQYNIILPAVYAMVTPKYFYNRQRRAENGKTMLYNSGNYIGARLKMTTPSLISTDGTRSAVLINVHWGMQRAIGGKWILQAHAGLGYAQSFGINWGTIYPALDLKFAYVLSGKKK